MRILRSSKTRQSYCLPAPRSICASFIPTRFRLSLSHVCIMCKFLSWLLKISLHDRVHLVDQRFVQVHNRLKFIVFSQQISYALCLLQTSWEHIASDSCLFPTCSSQMELGKAFSKQTPDCLLNLSVMLETFLTNSAFTKACNNSCARWVFFRPRRFS